jgi:hypothetical protein
MNPPLGHHATPGFLVSSLPKTEKCIHCGRYLRKSKTSPTGWRHSGLRG